MRLAALLFVAACAGPPPPVAMAPPSTTAPQVAIEPPTTCTGTRLLLTRDPEGLPTRAFVPATVDGESMVLWLDTGTVESHLVHGLTGASVGPARTVRFGEEERSWVSWRNRFQPGIDGLPMRGAIGTDEVLPQPTEIDLAHGCWTKFESVPEYAKAWPAIEIWIRQKMIVMQVEIDGRNAYLLVDTGVDETMLITDDEKPGQRFEVQDVFGLPVVLVRGAATLRFSTGETSHVTITRTKSFPTFDRLGLGPDVRGMLGLTSIGSRRIIIDAPGHRMLLQP